MNNISSLLMQHLENPQKALDVLADELARREEIYSVGEVISALREYQSEQKRVEIARKCGGVPIYTYGDLTDLAGEYDFLERDDGVEGSTDDDLPF
ncbi:hypothetical protein J4443_01805 [Candidatus Woesearchaeota archaeon]|nr:hypothetical protein [Candidatus Woesearchaeota archaeon]